MTARSGHGHPQCVVMEQCDAQECQPEQDEVDRDPCDGRRLRQASASAAAAAMAPELVASPVKIWAV